MKASDIKINNWLEYKGNNVQWDIKDYAEIYNSDILKNIKPIPLTEEILLKCGAIKQGYNLSVEGISIWYSSYRESYVIRYFFTGSDIERVIELKSLHSLQNVILLKVEVR